jgi:uncharacterized protein (DUF1800 family)
VNGPVDSQRRLLNYETSRRRFLAGVAATGVGTALATMWRLPELGSGTAQAATQPAGRAQISGAATSGATQQQSADLSTQIAHLLRRTGFAATPQQIAQYSALGIEGAVDAIMTWDTSKDPGLDYANSAGLDLSKLADAQRWWLLRMMYTDRPFQEKMTLFWHGVLTSAVYKVGTRYLNTMIAQNEFLRANALGKMETLLKGISRDPAMMVWLDLQTSTKAHPNENFARELMELFSLGIGNYTETDVRESARAFTGYSLDKDRNFYFNAKNHDGGQKTFLGQTGNFNGDDIIDIIQQQRAAAEFICTKLWKFFASPNPDPQTIGALADTYQSSGHSIRAVMRQLLTMPQFYSDDAMNSLIKSPVEFVVGTVQMLGLRTNAANYPAYLQQMGQELFNPPNVAGWPGGPAWLSSSSFFGRMNFLNYVIYSKDNGLDPVNLLGSYAGANPATVLDQAASLLGKPLGDTSRRAIMQFLGDSSNGSPTVTDKNVRSMLYLVLASPENMLV